MRESSSRGLMGLMALAGVSAWQNPLQMPLRLPTKLPWLSSGHAETAISRPPIDSDKLQAAISSENLMKRAEKLYELAKLSEDEWNHPTRVIGSKGHAATVEYITSSLLNLGGYYTVSKQPFLATTGRVFESRLILGNEVIADALPFIMTPPTKDKEPVHGDLVFVDTGCEQSDYPDAASGNVVLVQRGNCTFTQKSELAGKAGAITLIMYNNEDGVVQGNLSPPSPDNVATFGISKGDGERVAKALEDGESVDVIAYIDATRITESTDNVIAQTVGGDPDNCVMLGGHSDGVSSGPGINDDGSGSLSLLEIATQLAKFEVNNCVRFAWWSAEEEGLLGSDNYVSVLSKEENKKIRMFLDFDMMASPNFAYQIYNATNKENPVGSGELKKLFSDWYEHNGHNYTYIPFDGRSDYDPFIRGGIPGGGVATGAEGLKTEEEVAMFGGKAGDQYDMCYHELCDNLGNVNYTAWEVNTKLIAHSVATYAKSMKGFPERADDFNVATYSQSVKYHGHALVM